jgi:hypothetical protein
MLSAAACAPRHACALPCVRFAVVEWRDVVGAGTVHRRQCIFVEVSRSGIRTRVAGSRNLLHLAGARRHSVGHSDQRSHSLLRSVLHICDFLVQAAAVFSQSVSGRIRSLAYECRHCFSDIRKGRAGVSHASRVACSQLPTLRGALDVCARTAIPRQAFMKLILLVFGIAIVLLLVWVVLWVLAMRERT